MLNILTMFICIFQFIPSFARAAGDLQTDLRNASRSLIEKDRVDEAFIDRLLKIWEQKCSKPNDDDEAPACMLLESDVYPGGSQERALLFRGEKNKFDLPGVSPSALTAAKGSALCAAPCSLATYSDRIRDILTEVSEHHSFALIHRFYEEAYFDERDMTWKLESNKPTGPDGLPSLIPLPAESQPGARKILPLELAASAHIQHGVANAINPQGKRTGEFDPFVSYSRNPRVAVFFSQSPVPNQARIIIASVPKSVLERKADCATWPKTAGVPVVEATACDVGGGETFEHETEIDFLWFTDPAFVKDVLVTTSQQKRIPFLN